jgi:predicted signal transduction protein with EAL and GGDEF domain
MAQIGLPELLTVSLVATSLLVVTVLPFWMIFKKAGFSPWLALTQLVPLVNLAALFYLAFAEWPIHRDLRR